MKQTFRLSKRSLSGFAMFSLAIAIILLVAFKLEQSEPVGYLFALPLPLLLMLMPLFGFQLTISDQGLRQSYVGFTYETDWSGIAEVTDRGLKTSEPCLTYNKWNPLNWKAELWGVFEPGLNPNFVRNIQMKSFETNWPEGRIGREVCKYIPELMLKYRNNKAPKDKREKA